MNTIEWARKNGRHFHWRCAVDNYEPTREWAEGDCWFYDGIPQGHGFVLDLGVLPTVQDGHRAVYLLDDGEVVKPYYVVSYGHLHVVLHPFPTAGLDWALGPRKAYHLKITRSEAPIASERHTGASGGADG